MDGHDSCNESPIIGNVSSFFRSFQDNQYLKRSSKSFRTSGVCISVANGYRVYKVWYKPRICPLICCAFWVFLFVCFMVKWLFAMSRCFIPFQFASLAHIILFQCYLRFPETYEHNRRLFCNIRTFLWLLYPCCVRGAVRFQRHGRFFWCLYP